MAAKYFDDFSMIFDLKFQSVACLAIYWHNDSKILLALSAQALARRVRVWKAKQPSICGLLHFGGTSFESISTWILDTIICQTVRLVHLLAFAIDG